MMPSTTQELAGIGTPKNKTCGPNGQGCATQRVSSWMRAVYPPSKLATNIQEGRLYSADWELAKTSSARMLPNILAVFTPHQPVQLDRGAAMSIQQPNNGRPFPAHRNPPARGRQTPPSPLPGSQSAQSGVAALQRGAQQRQRCSQQPAAALHFGSGRGRKTPGLRASPSSQRCEADWRKKKKEAAQRRGLQKKGGEKTPEKNTAHVGGVLTCKGSSKPRAKHILRAPKV